MTKTTKNRVTLFPLSNYQSGGSSKNPTPEQLAELARKQMMEIASADSYVRRLGNFYPKDEIDAVHKNRLHNIQNTPIKYIDFSIAPTQAMYTYGYDLLGQPKNAQIEIYKDSKNKLTTYLHELVHASTMSNRDLSKGEQEYIKSRVKQPEDGDERGWYITDGTEVLARKSVVAKWAADNGIIDINSDIDESTFNLIGETLKGKKDKQSKEVLRHYNELLEATDNKPKNVIDIWNTVAQVGADNTITIAQDGISTNNMKKTKYQQGGAPNQYGYYGGAGDLLTSLFGNINSSGLLNKKQDVTPNLPSYNEWLKKNGYTSYFDKIFKQGEYKDYIKENQSFNEVLPLGIQLAGLMDLQMREQDEVANKKMTVQDFPTTTASYAPVGFAEDGGGITSMQGMFPALDSLKFGLPKEMPKKARKLVAEAAAKEVGHLEQMLGYRDDSPFKNKPTINISSDTITMDGVGKTLLATSDNGITKILKPYSGTHYFPGASVVTEVPLAKNGGTLEYKQGGQPTPNNNNEIIKLLGMNKYQIMPNLQMIMQQGGFTKLKSDAGDPYQYEYDPQNDDYYVITPQGKTIKVKKGSKSDAAIRKRYQSGWSVVTKDEYKDTPYYDSVIDPKREKYLMPKDRGTPSDSTDYYSEYYDDESGVNKGGFYRKSDVDGGARELNPEEYKKAKDKFRGRFGYNSIDPINGYIGIDGVDDNFKYNPVTGDIIEEVEEWDDASGKQVKVRKKVRGDAYNKMRSLVRKKGVATGLVPADDEYTKREDSFLGRMYNKWLFQEGGQPTVNNIPPNLTGIEQDYIDVVSDDKDPYEYRYDNNTDTWETRLKGKGKKWIKVKGNSKRMTEANAAIRGRYDKQHFIGKSNGAELYSSGPVAPQISVQLLPTKVNPYVKSISNDSDGFRDSKTVYRSSSHFNTPTTTHNNTIYTTYPGDNLNHYDGVIMSPSMVNYESSLYKKDKLIDELLSKLTDSYNPTQNRFSVFNPMEYRRKYMNGGRVTQNYLPVGNGKTNINGYIPLSAMIPIQTEKGEMIVLETGDLVPVNAKKRHSQMSDDEVTDIVPENSYILSQFGSVNIYKSEADKVEIEVENKPYNLYGTNPTPKIKTLGDIMRKKVMKPADMARLVEQKYKIIDHDDPFTIQTNAINKHRRRDYLQAIIQLSEYDKARKGIDNSIETQLSQNNQQVPQMVASNGGKVMKAGYNVPKAFNPLDLIGSLVNTGVSAYQNWKARKRADKLMNQQLRDINTYNTDVRRNLGLGLGIGAATTLLQDPTINPEIESDQFISQLPSYVNASNNAIFEGNRNNLYANRADTSAMTPQMAMLFGERYNAQTMQSQGQLAAQLAGQRANTFAQYLQARQNIFNKNAASRTAATNATRANQNSMMTTLGGMGMGYFDNLNNLSSNVLNARAAARGQNTATQIQLGNQMAQTLNNGLAAGLQAYNSSKNSTGVGGYSTNTATRAQQKRQECNNRGGQWICEDGICFCDN